ncbi:hypothetical protein GQR58_012820 [Nymphon striatum]|nr:hypothetical protein GQR58_012820 [Nymphon striatum]
MLALETGSTAAFQNCHQLQECSNTPYFNNILHHLTVIPTTSRLIGSSENEGVNVLKKVSSASHETSPRIHRAVTELDEEENWRERVEVLTKQDHGEYTQYAQDILNDLISSLPEESSASLPHSGNNYEEPAAAATTFDYSLDNSSFSDYESATEESKLGDLSIGTDEGMRLLCPAYVVEEFGLASAQDSMERIILSKVDELLLNLALTSDQGHRTGVPLKSHSEFQKGRYLNGELDQIEDGYIPLFKFCTKMEVINLCNPSMAKIDDNPRTICPSEIIETKHPVNDTVHPNTQTGNTVTETELQSNLNSTDSDKKQKNFVNISTDAHSAIVNDSRLNELQEISSNKLEEHIEDTCAGEESVTKCETSVQEILEVHQQDSITKKSVLANLEESSVVLSEQSTQNFEKDNFINKENLESNFPSVLAQPLLVADSEEICNDISSSDEIASGKIAEDFPPVTSKDTIQSFNENINSLKQCVDIVVEPTENIVEPVNKEDFSDQFDKSINSQKQCVDILAEQKEQFIEPFNSKESIEQFDENRNSQKPCVDIVVEPKEQFIEPVNKDYSTDQFDENINLQKRCVDIVAEPKEQSIEHFNSEESIEQFDENINLQKPCVDIVVEPTEKFVEPVNKEDFSNQFDKSINLQKQCVDILAEQKEQSIEPVNSEESIEQFDENLNLQKPCVDIVGEPNELFIEPVNKEDSTDQFDKNINLRKQCVDFVAEPKEQSIEHFNSEESIEQFDENLNLQKPCVDISVEPTEKLIEPANKEDFSDQFDKSINLQEQCVDFVAEPKEQSIEHFNSEESIEQFDENLNLQKPCVDILVEPTEKFVEPVNIEDFSDQIDKSINLQKQCIDFVAEPKEQSIEHFNSEESIEQFDENLNLQKPCVDILVEPTETFVELANKEDFSDQFDKSINLQKQCVDILAEQKDQSIEPFNSEESIEQFDENRNSQKPCVDIVVEPKEQFIEPIDNKENNKVGPDFISGKPDPYIIEECASTVTEYNIQISNNSVQNLCAKQESNIINESTDNLLSFKTPSKTAINQPVSFDIENNAKALYKDLENSQGKITSVEECETPSFEDKNFVTGESSIVSLEPSKNSPDTIMDDAVPETPINNTENLPENSTHDSNNIDNVDTTMDSSENLPAKPAVNAYNFDFDPDFNPFATRSNVSSSPPKGSSQLADEDFNPFKTVSKVSSSPPPNSGLQTNVSLTEINLNKEKLDLDIIAQVKSNNSVHEVESPVAPNFDEVKDIADECMTTSLSDSTNPTTENSEIIGGPEDEVSVTPGEPCFDFDIEFDENFDPFATSSNVSSSPTKKTLQQETAQIMNKNLSIEAKENSFSNRSESVEPVTPADVTVIENENFFPGEENSDLEFKAANGVAHEEILNNGGNSFVENLMPLTTNNDSDAMCLARTAQIIRTDMFQELFSFKGSFSSKCQEKSLSLVLIAMVSMLLEGPNVLKQTAHPYICMGANSSRSTGLQNLYQQLPHDDGCNTVMKYDGKILVDRKLQDARETEESSEDSGIQIFMPTKKGSREEESSNISSKTAQSHHSFENNVTKRGDSSPIEDFSALNINDTDFKQKISENNNDIKDEDTSLKNQSEAGPDIAEFTDEEFKSAVEFFKDPAAFEFLQKAGNSKTFEQSTLARMSLYVKFDPLLKQDSPTRRTSMQLQNEASRSATQEENDSSTDGLCKLIDFSPSPKKVVSQTDKHAQEVTKENPNMEMPGNNDAKLMSKVKKTDIKAFTEEEMNQALKMQELLYQERLLKKDKQWNEKCKNANRERDLESSKVNSLHESQSQMT